MDDTVRRLVALCGIFAESTGRSISTVSRYATGSGETIARLRRGHAITTRRAERALRFLSDNWPEPVEWPADIPRPAVAPDPADEPDLPVPALGDGRDALSVEPLSSN
ncbi:MAG: hypothetical protein J4G16_02090 [Acidobacteria bacterium]|nr:hypothetical protein [Acidobacteriota bacterium]